MNEIKLYKIDLQRMLYSKLSMKPYLGKRGYSIYKESLSTQELDKVKKELTVKPFVPKSSVPMKAFPIYRESSQKLYVPRYYGFDKFTIPDDIRVPCGMDLGEGISFKGSLRDYQNTISDKFVASAHELGGGLLEVDTGLGKTVIALNIITRLKKKTLIIVHKEFLMDQWIERIGEFIPTARVGKIQGKKIEIDDKDICIGMLQSLSMKDYESNLFDSFGFTIIDEVHHLGAEVFSQALSKIITTYALGLSATMERKDGLTKVFKMFMGPIVHTEKRDTKGATIFVKVVEYQNDDEEFSQVKHDYRGNPMYSSMITKLCAYTHRTEMILNVLKYLRTSQPAQQVMILAHNKSILTYLHDAIKERNIASVGYYVGGMRKEALKESESKQVIVATYSMASEGLDIKSLASLIMATPKTDIVQTVGRILRAPHDEPTIVDIVDQHDLFRRQYSQRKRFYMKQKYEITKANGSEFRETNQNINWKTLNASKSRGDYANKTSTHKQIQKQKHSILDHVKIFANDESKTDLSAFGDAISEDDDLDEVQKTPKCLISFGDLY